MPHNCGHKTVKVTSLLPWARIVPKFGATMHSLVKGDDNPNQIITPPRRNESKTRTRRDGERFGCLQILDYGTKINGFRIEGLVLCDLRTVQHLETITFDHLLSAPTLEGNDLAVNPFLARAIEITQVRAHQGASRR